MADVRSTRPWSEADARHFRLVFTYLIILVSFAIIAILSRPILLSTYLWVFQDRGNLLNLDYLVDLGLKPGVDTYYSYGLLPVLVQHELFALFGRGYGPMLACTLVYYALMAGFWALLLARLPKSRIWLLAVIALAPILLWINPNFPYCLVLISMSFALLLVLDGRSDLALAVSAIGVFSVPSLPIVLSVLIVLLIFFEWRAGGDHSLRALVIRLVPGLAAFLLVGAALTAVYGWRPVSTTLLPLAGAQFYKESHLGLGTTVLQFLFPEQGVSHFVLSRPAWWVASGVFLVIFGAIALFRLIRRRTLDPAETFVLFCAIIHVVFVGFAYGYPLQHILYDPLLAAGVLVAIATMAHARLRGPALAGFVGLAVLGHVAQARQTWLAWRDWKTSPASAGLYADAAWTAEWSKILEFASQNRLLLLSYGTGVHHYFPNVESPAVWYLQAGQLLPSDKQRVLRQMKGADIIVEDLGGHHVIIDQDPEFRGQLDSLCLTDVTRNFQIWRRHPGSESCKTNPL